VGEQFLIPEGSGRFTIAVERSGGPIPLDVFSYRPPGLSVDAPVFVVVHGVARNARTYRDAWIETARALGALLLAPHFSRESYPTPREFEVGGMRDAERRALPRPVWTYHAIERLFDEARASLGLATDAYLLYGHSAGGQMGDMAVEADLRSAFARRLTILLGERDDDPDHGQLLKSPEAMRQGPHRLARGRYYFRHARETAAALGAPFDWRLATVPDIGHSNARLAPHAGRLLLEP
jgi:hypothetical protein